MPFTDEDLKRLKDYYEDPKRGDIPLKWKALLARLHAAEVYAHYGKLLHGGECVGECDMCKASEAWRKSAGKDK